MPNSENYEKYPGSKLIALLVKCDWLRGQGFWEKGNVRLLVDQVGIFLFRWLGSKWVRTHGLAYASMWRAPRTLEMVFLDGSKLNLEYGLFTPAPSRKRKRR